MIASQLYPTQTTQNVGETANQFQEAFTNALQTLGSGTTQEAYWLGWIRPENLPTWAKHCHVYIDEDLTEVKFIRDTVVDNSPCGYVKMYNNFDTIAYLEDGEPYVNGSNYQYFINNLHPEYSALCLYNTSVTVRFLGFFTSAGEIMSRGNNDIDQTNIQFGNGYNDGIQGLFDFLHGEKTITVSKTVSGTPLTFDITLDGAFVSGYGLVFANEDSSIALNLYMIGFTTVPHYARNGSSRSSLQTMFSAKISWIDEDNETSADWNVALGSVNAAIGYLRNDDWVYTSPRYRTGANATFDYADFRNLDVYTGYLMDGNVFCYAKYGSGGVNHFTYAYLILTPDEILKQLALYYRVDFSTTTTTPSSNPMPVSYIDGVTYATNVTSENEFTAELKTGNISNETFRNSLRYWQYSAFINDEFSEEDIPPYEPEPSDEPEELGDLIARPSTLGIGGTLGFITQYALTAAQVSNLGRLLWTSFLDPDYYKNYLFTLALDTGSFSMSSLLTYFISLRVYPFPLINVPSHASAGNDMFVGSGTVPLTFGTTLHTINNFADYIDAGSVTVPSHYGDFRDYTDTQYMLYLPYCGTVQLNAGDVVGNTLSVQYAVDFASGGCIAYVDLRTGDGHGYPIAALPGQIGADVPLSATNAGQVAAQFARDAMNIAQIIGSVPEKQVSSGISGFMAARSGNVGGAISGLADVWGAPAEGAAGYAAKLGEMATRPAIGIPMLSGGRGFGAFGAPQTAYLQIRRGIYKQPDNYAHTVGYSATTAKKIAALSGWVAGLIDTSSLNCTADEQQAIAAMVQAGIIV